MTDESALLSLAGLIDHTILAPDAGQAQVLRFCEEALTHRFRAVCVNPIHVKLVAEKLRGSNVRTCSVVGFPLGATPPEMKAAEAARACADGADEIDMVIAIGALKAGDHEHLRRDIAAVRKAAGQATLKVIIETCLLTDAEKRISCQIAKQEGADFVKTSTGFSSSGATIADVALMRETVGPDIGVKASGGIRTLEAAQAMVAAGANRIGTSSGVAIIGGRAAAEGTY
jgi:deoxyribose-phosphate aldolase